MESVRCAQCSADAPSRLLAVPDTKRQQADAFWLVQCRNCGLVYLNPRPTTIEMSGYYDGSYGPHAAAYSGTSEPTGSDDRYYRDRVEQLLRALPHWFRGNRLLDVGCGDGHWLHLMGNREWRVAGVEPSPRASAFAREHYGLDVRTGELTEQAFPAGSFDAVTFWHSLEHVHDPRAAMVAACRLLSPGGIVAVQVPNIDTVLFRFFGPRYSMIQAPFHLYHFSASTLASLLQNSGFQVYRTVYSPGTDGIAISLSNWWSSRNRAARGPQVRRDGARRTTGRDLMAALRRRIALPMLQPLGRCLAATGHGDVFTMYAAKHRLARECQRLA